MTGDIPRVVAERAATNYVEDEHGCWVSTYSVGSHGYGQVGWNVGGHREATTVHRAAWVYYTGEQPGELTVDHRPECNRKCVHPEHLRLLSNADNGRRNGVDRDYPLDWTCKRNHGVERTAGGNCPECVKVNKAEWVAAHPDRRKEQSNRYKRKLRERV